MPYDQYLINRIMGAVRAHNFTKGEELWRDLQGSHKPLLEIDPFFTIAKEVADRGNKEHAAELLLLLKDDLKDEGREDELFEVLRTAVKYSGKVRQIREDLVEQYKRVYGERPGFDAVMSKVDLAGDGPLKASVAQLDQAFSFQSGDYVHHRKGWGVGEVVEAHPETGEFVIDFVKRKGQRMEAGMALKALERRSANDLDVMLWKDPDRVKSMATEDPLELLRRALSSFGGKLQSRDLRDRLSGVLEKSGWTKFWAAARKKAKNDSMIEVGPAPRSIITLRDEPLSRNDELVETLRKTTKFKERIETISREISALRKDAGDVAPDWLDPALALLAEKPHRATALQKQAHALERALIHDTIAQVWPKHFPDLQATTDGGTDPDTGEPTPAQICPPVLEQIDMLDEANIADVLREVTLTEHRKRVVQHLPSARPEDHTELLTAVLLKPAPHTFLTTIDTLKKRSREDLVEETIQTIVVKPTQHPEAYAALSKARLNGRLEALEDRRDTELLAKALKLLDTINLRYKEATDKTVKARLKSNVDTLRAIFSDKSQSVLRNVIEQATEDEVRRIFTLTRQSPSLSATVRRATEKFVVKRFPAMIAAFSKAQGSEDPNKPTLYSTPDGKRRRERELSNIMEVEFENVRIEIGKALEFGDISENAELDAAREKQQRLAERAERIREELERVVILDVNDVQTDRVGVGTRVTVTNLENQEEESYTLLGPWDLDDSDPTIISHLSPMAMGLIGTSKGKVAEVKLPDGSKLQYKVKSIEKAVLQET